MWYKFLVKWSVYAIHKIYVELVIIYYIISSLQCVSLDNWVISFHYWAIYWAKFYHPYISCLSILIFPWFYCNHIVNTAMLCLPATDFMLVEGVQHIWIGPKVCYIYVLLLRWTNCHYSIGLYRMRPNYFRFSILLQ